MTLNPKTRFLATDHAKFHAELVTKEPFRHAIESAHAYWHFNQGPLYGETPLAESYAFKAEGIREFIDVLMNLAEPNLEPPKPIRQNLKPVP